MTIQIDYEAERKLDMIMKNWHQKSLSIFSRQRTVLMMSA